MPDVFSQEKRSEVMRGIRSKNTRPELMVRSYLHKEGIRFRLHRGDLPGKPDIVVVGLRTAIQVRGCYWHGHGCWLAHVPGSRREYWLPKIEGNAKRDKRNDRKLRRLGWKVIVVWECKCRKIDAFEGEMRRVLRAIGRGGGS